MRRIFTAFFILLSTFNSIAAQKQIDVIAHRGASGYLPEHTIEALILAYSHGANYIEQDLVLSKDLVLVVLHDIHLETVTNVEQVFPHRKRADGRYYAFDFTLAELKSLMVHERTNSNGIQVFPNRFAGQSNYQIATFQEQIDLLKHLNKVMNKNVGLYAEIKSPQWHIENGADISQFVIKQLRENNLDSSTAKIYIQCFDFNEIKRIRNKLQAKVKLVQLLGENDWGESTSDYEYLQTTAGLQAIAEVAQGIGPWIPQVINSQTKAISSLVKRAHAKGLIVHPYTFRKDQLPEGFNANTLLQTLFEEAKIDGLFTDFTDVVVEHLQ